MATPNRSYFHFTEKMSGSDLDISANTYKLTVNSEKDPTDTSNEQFSLTGAFVTDGTDGRIQFAPTAVQSDLPKQKFYYDLERNSPAGIKTVAKGVFAIEMDITK